MQDRVRGPIQLLEHTPEIEFGQSVFGFKLHGNRKLFARLLHPAQLVHRGSEVNARFHPFRRCINRVSISLGGLVERFGI